MINKFIYLKFICSIMISVVLFSCQQQKNVEVILSSEDPFDWFLNYPPIELKQGADRINHIVFSDTSLKIPYIYSYTDSIYFDLNKDGTILKTEYLQFSDYNIFGQKRLFINFHPNISNRSSLSIIKFFNSKKIYQFVSELYTGYFYENGDSVKVGIFLSPNYYKYQKSPGLFIAINSNNDSVFDSDEIFPLQYVFPLNNNNYEFIGFEHLDNDITAVFTKTSKRIGPHAGLYHPNFQFTSIEDNTIHTLDEFIGNITVINWWFTTCSPCIKKIPTLNNIKIKYPNVKFIAINPVDNTSTIKKFLYTNRFHFDHFNTNQQNAMSLRVKSMPHTVIVDEDLKIIYKGRGSIKDIKNILEKHIN